MSQDTKDYINDRLLTQLGRIETIEILEFILPILKSRQVLIDKLLDTENYTSAQQEAHKLLSSVQLYGNTKLIVLLTQLSTLEQTFILTNDFKTQLSNEFSNCLHTIKEWLLINKKTDGEQG